MATEERALRAELDVLTRKKEQIQSTRRSSGNRGNSDRMTGNNNNQYSRANNAAGKASSAAQRRGSGGSTGSGGRRIESGRLGKRPNDRPTDSVKADEDNSSKRQRLSLGDAKESPRASGEARKADAPKETTVNEREKRRTVATYAQKDGLARSRRMFGALMGHLGKAKAMIEKDSTLLQKQTSKQLEAEQKEKEQSKALEIKAKRDATVARLENLIAMAEIEMKELMARAKLQHLQQARKGAALARFLLTVSSPPIYYLPKKHTKETEDLVAASVEAHDEKMVVSNREHQVKLREIEAEYTAKMDQYKLELDEATRASVGEIENTEEAKGKEEVPAPVDAEIDCAESKDEAMEPAKDQEDTRSHEEPQEPQEPLEPAHMPSPAPPASAMETSVASPSRDPPASTERPVSRKRSAETDDVDESSKRSKLEAAEEGVDQNMAEADKSARPEATEVQAGPTDSASLSTAATADKPAAVEASGNAVDDKNDAAPATPQKPTINVAKLRVTDLREELKKRGLDTKGNKPVLVKRLEEALNQAAH